MGAAMAPAAAMTISDFFSDTGMKPDDLDMILTGDLGYVGSELLLELLQKPVAFEFLQFACCSLKFLVKIINCLSKWG